MTTPARDISDDVTIDSERTTLVGLGGVGSPRANDNDEGSGVRRAPTAPKRVRNWFVRDGGMKM